MTPEERAELCREVCEPKCGTCYTKELAALCAEVRCFLGLSASVDILTGAGMVRVMNALSARSIGYEITHYSGCSERCYIVRIPAIFAPSGAGDIRSYHEDAPQALALAVRELARWSKR